MKVFDNVEKIIANSEYTKNLAISIGLNSEKIVVINPGVNPPKDLNKKSLDKFMERMGYVMISSTNLEDTIRKNTDQEEKNILTCVFKKLGVWL